MKNALRTLMRDEKGQGMTEYGLILGLIAIVLVTVLGTMGTTLQERFGDIIKGLGGTPPAQ